MQVVLVMFKSSGDHRSFSLHKDLTIIGRREDCDLRIPLSEISRKHCRVMKEGDSLRIEDLGSSNGTYHNGQRVQEAVVQAGDAIQLGSMAFIVQIDGVPAEEDMQAPVAVAAPDETGVPTVDADAGDPDDSGNAPLPADSGDPAEFDPMAILESTDAPAEDGSALGIDIEESNHGQRTEA